MTTTAEHWLAVDTNRWCGALERGMVEGSWTWKVCGHVARWERIRTPEEVERGVPAKLRCNAHLPEGAVREGVGE